MFGVNIMIKKEESKGNILKDLYKLIEPSKLQNTVHSTSSYLLTALHLELLILFYD